MLLSKIIRLLCGLTLLLSIQTFAQAAEKNLMHCFAWTPVTTATPADWEAFYRASDALPKKIKGVIKVWYGKLDQPLGQVSVVGDLDEATRAKYRAGEKITAPLSRFTREYGMCMLMKDAAARKAYAEAPYHKVWTDAYAKIRVDGTTTFDFLTQ